LNFIRRSFSIQRIAPLNDRRILVVQHHVHPAERPGAAIDLLPKKAVVVPSMLRNFVGYADQQRAGAAGRVADAVARLRFEELRQQHRDLTRGIELSAFFARSTGKVFNHVHISVADDVFIYTGGAKIEARVGEIFQQVLETAVAIADLA